MKNAGVEDWRSCRKKIMAAGCGDVHFVPEKLQPTIHQHNRQLRMMLKII